MGLLVSLVGFWSAALAVAGNEPGHGGDPLEHDFRRRAAFVRDELRAGIANGSQLVLAVYEQALAGLEVRVSDEWQSTAGRVLPHETIPGKSFVRLHRQLYLQALQNRYQLDVSVFVAHEVLETVGYDIDKSITAHWHFSEARFDNWGRANPATVGGTHVSSPYGTVQTPAGGTVIVSPHGTVIAPAGTATIVSPNGAVVAPGGSAAMVGAGGAQVTPMPPASSREWVLIGQVRTREDCDRAAVLSRYRYFWYGGRIADVWYDNACFGSIRY